MRIKREISKHLKEALDKYPIAALTGPRQSGKTTLLKELFPEYTYISLENPDNREFALNDPNGFLKRYSTKIILDEVQRAPSLFSYLQTHVDEANVMGQFILSGSQNFLLIREITQSLAGRVALFKLFPFDIQELKSEHLLHDDFVTQMTTGFYPAIYDRNINPQSYYSNYLQTYIQRDVSEIIGIKDTSLFRKFLGLLAARVGQLLNMNAIANDCGVSQPTIKSWLSALESSYILFTLQPYYENFNKRIMKSPKVYFYDTGLLCFLLKLKATELYSHPIKGSLFENMIVSEFIKRNHHKESYLDFWFWRDSAGNEVDLLYLQNNQLVVTEIKATQTITQDQFKGLSYFEKYAKGKVLTKHLIYAGTETQKRTIGKVDSWRNFSENIDTTK